jgi:hypothetical protein
MMDYIFSSKLNRNRTTYNYATMKREEHRGWGSFIHMHHTTQLPIYMC